jgi:mRNA m6A methyltransferase catalytic subunit
MDITQQAAAAAAAAADLPDVEQLSKLVTEDDKVVETRWKQQPLHELDTTIHDYRSHIKQLEAQLGDQPGTAWPQHSDPATHNGNTTGNCAPGGEVYGSVDDLDPTEWQVPPHCIPIHANVTTYDWKQLYSHTQFDVIMMDPPWQLATANPTRGVALGYSQLTDNDITALPVNKLQSDGFLFVWVINAKYKYTLDLFDKWGYRWDTP